MSKRLITSWWMLLIEIYCFHKVRTQHMERNIQFLVDELKVVDKKEGEDRVFFVSAREALTCRTHQDKGTPTPRELSPFILNKLF